MFSVGIKMLSMGTKMADLCEYQDGWSLWVPRWLVSVSTKMFSVGGLCGYQDGWMIPVGPRWLVSVLWVPK